MDVIEWKFTVLSFISFFFFISKKASQPSFRIIGWIISIIINLLLALFTLSIGVLSLRVINIFYVFLDGYGIFTCYVEINREFVRLQG